MGCEVRDGELGALWTIDASAHDASVHDPSRSSDERGGSKKRPMRNERPFGSVPSYGSGIGNRSAMFNTVAVSHPEIALLALDERREFVLISRPTSLVMALTVAIVYDRRQTVPISHYLSHAIQYHTSCSKLRERNSST
jgi:hypothetical protein